MLKVIKDSTTYRIYLFLFLLIFASDLVSKLLTYHFLEFNTDYKVISGIFFRTVLNNQESERVLNVLLSENESVISYSIFIAVSALLTALFIIFINRYKISKWLKIIFVLGFNFIFSFLSDFFIPITDKIHISYHTSLWLSISATIIFFSSVFYVSRAKINRLFLICIIASGCGNLISHFYPPFFVIDFIYIPGIFPGIFNLSDFFYFLFLVLFALYNIYLSILDVKKIILKLMNRYVSHKTPLQAVIFDMDGVIVNSETYHYNAETLIFTEIGVSLSDEERNTFIGLSTRKMYSKIRERFSISLSLPEMIEIDKKIRIDYFSEINKVEPIDGIRELLVFLRKKNIKTAVASSSSYEIIKLLIDKLGLNDFFCLFVSGDDVSEGKPAPDIFLKTTKLLEVDTNKCIIIEDSTNGVKAANRAAIKVIGFQNPESGNQDISSADTIVSSIKQINYKLLMSLLDSHK